MLLLRTEFVAVMSRKVNASYTAEQVKSAFKVRVKGEGYIYMLYPHRLLLLYIFRRCFERLASYFYDIPGVSQLLLVLKR